MNALLQKGLVTACVAGLLPRNPKDARVAFGPLGDIGDGELAIAVAGSGSLPSVPTILLVGSPIASAPVHAIPETPYAGADPAWQRYVPWRQNVGTAAPPIDPERLMELAKGRTLLEPIDKSITRLLADSCCAYPIVFAKPGKQRFDRLADGLASAKAPPLARYDDAPIVAAAYELLTPEPRPIKDILREARSKSKTSTDDAVTLARALYERFKLDDVDLSLGD